MWWPTWNYYGLASELAFIWPPRPETYLVFMALRTAWPTHVGFIGEDLSSAAHVVISDILLVLLGQNWIRSSIWKWAAPRWLIIQSNVKLQEWELFLHLAAQWVELQTSTSAYKHETFEAIFSTLILIGLATVWTHPNLSILERTP